MMRIPLERLCLQLKSILSEDVAVGEALAGRGREPETIMMILSMTANRVLDLCILSTSVYTYK